MKNSLLTVVLLLTVSFAFATNDAEKISIYDIENSIDMVSFDNSKDKPLACTSTTVTVTTHYPDGTTTITTTTTVECDTPQELAQYTKAIK